MVQQINTSIDDICSCLFEQDIKIELSLFKTLKVSERVKHVVNFSIFYKNGVYDHSHDLSGGEENRVSVIITLALNNLYQHKLIMFDETSGSLNVDLKNTVIKTITDYMKGTVIIIEQSGVEGIYDYIIDVDQFKT